MVGPPETFFMLNLKRMSVEKGSRCEMKKKILERENHIFVLYRKENEATVTEGIVSHEVELVKSTTLIKMREKY